jgi:glycosyltransferase involved in cell wall biosynthesis
METTHYYSLIIPCFNEEETIREVVESSRRYVNEIIVVDDNSTDNSKKILETINHIFLIENNTTRGQEWSIEQGIKEATGEVIVLMDADLEHNPKDILRFKSFFVSHDVDFILGKRTYIPRYGERRLSKIFEEKYGVTDVMNGFRLFKKRLFEEIGFYFKNDFYGLDFLMEVLKRYTVNQIPLTEKKRRVDSRLGSDDRINEKLDYIIKYVEKEFEYDR